MDPQASTSFIPKKPLTAEGSRPRRGGGLVTLVSFLVFFVSALGAGGVFLYQQYLQTSITSKSDSLARAEAAYEPGVIQDLMRLDARIGEARSLLEQHVAPTALFAFLAGATLESVQFTSFDYTLQADGSAQVSMEGIARSFSSVALQSDSFGASRVLRNVVFSDITITPTGSVTFTVSAVVDPSLILYARALTQPNPL